MKNQGTLETFGIVATEATAAVAAMTLRQLMQERTTRGETYFYQHDGMTYCWDVSKAWRLLLEKPREPDLFRPADQGVDIHHVLDRYPDMDVDYALTCDTRLPLLFVPYAGCHQLIDGWHRLARCLIEEEVLYQATMPAFALTQEEADAILLWKRSSALPTEKGRASPHEASG